MKLLRFLIPMTAGLALALSFFGHASTRREVVTDRGERLQFVSRSYLNENRQREYAFTLIEENAIVPDGKTDVLYGRDLDGDSKPELWFSVGASGGVQAYYRDARESDGWDVAQDLLANELDLHKRGSGRRFFGWLYRNWTLSGSALHSSIQTLARVEMDLRELETRAERLRLVRPADPSLPAQYRLIAEGWSYFNDTVLKKEIRNEILWILADGVTVGVGGKILRGAGTAVQWITPKVLTEAVEKLYSRYVAAAVERSGEAMNRITARLGGDRVAAETAAQALSRLSVRERVALQIQALSARSVVARILADAAVRSLKVIGAGIKGGAREWKYVAGTAGLQLGAEIFNNREALFDPNPIILTEKVMNDRDLLQNIGFMTMETFNAAAVSSQVESVKNRLAIGAVMSTVNSSAMSYYVKGETDVARMMLDTGWEVAVGNTQVQVDFAAMKYFENVAARTGNPKMKLLGYAVVIVDQFTGYVAYSMATRAYESRKAKPKSPSEELPPVVFVPVIGP